MAARQRTSEISQNGSATERLARNLAPYSSPGGTGSVCMIHHCLPSMETELQLGGIMAASSPSKKGSSLSVISCAPGCADIPSSSTRRSGPTNRTPAETTVIRMYPTIVFVT